MTGSPRRVIVDSSVAIASFRRDAAVLQRLAVVESVVPTTVLGELLYGAYGAAHEAQELTYIATLVARSTVVDCTQATAERYGQIKQALRRHGTPIPENDIWIAASALEHGLPVVTRDSKHFSRVAGLIVEAW